ncbi:MAG TPA: hypothetical protein DEV78_03200 [Clostridiales bacterium]|nr:hypothetical protein [Clostridiales bacterium]
MQSNIHVKIKKVAKSKKNNQKKTFGCTHTKDEIGEIVYKGLKWQTDSICRLLMASCRTVKENHK